MLTYRLTGITEASGRPRWNPSTIPPWHRKRGNQHQFSVTMVRPEDGAELLTCTNTRVSSRAM
jgi:hypothetical protein